MIFGAGSTHRLAQHFHTATGFFHSSSTQGFQFRKCAHGISQEQTQSPRSLDQGIHAFLSTTQANGFRDESRYSAEIVPVPRTEVQFRMKARDHSRLSSGFLFACTRVDTCHPGNCMHPIRTPSSHHLETHGSFQRT
jgi:hypothetical protein